MFLQTWTESALCFWRHRQNPLQDFADPDQILFRPKWRPIWVKQILCVILLLQVNPPLCLVARIPTCKLPGCSRRPKVIAQWQTDPVYREALSPASFVVYVHGDLKTPPVQHSQQLIYNSMVWQLSEWLLHFYHVHEMHWHMIKYCTVKVLFTRIKSYHLKYNGKTNPALQGLD